MALQTVVSLPWGCWDLNLGHLEEQSVPLADEPPLQPRYCYILLLENTKGMDAEVLMMKTMATHLLAGWLVLPV